MSMIFFFGKGNRIVPFGLFQLKKIERTFDTFY